MKPAAIKQKIAAALLSVPVFVKVMGIALGLTVLLGAGMLWQIHQTRHAMLRRELQTQARIIGQGLAAHCAEFVLTRNLFDLQRLLDATAAHLPDVAYLLVLDANGRVLADTLDGEPSAELLAANPPARDTPSRVVLLQTQRGPLCDVAVPILEGRAGLIRVGMSEHRLAEEVGWLTRRLARVTAVIAALGMLAAWWLTRIFSRPIGELISVARAVQQGDFGARAIVRAGDEVGELAVAFNEMTAALQQKEAIRQKLLRRVIEAGEEERKRLARELHDQTGQLLTSLIAGLGALEAGAPDELWQGKLRELRALAAQTLSEVHDVALALRPSVLDDAGLVAALKKHCENFARHFNVELDCQAVGLNEACRLPPEHELTLYRIVQEAITNAVRHGGATAVHVLLQRKDSAVLAVIEDNGKGFDVTSWRTGALGADRLGLLGIEERAALLGGTLRVESRPGAGTSLFVEIPCPESAS
jgi:signal transduction histidine kinase